MSEHRVAIRYARALFQLAEEQGAAPALQEELKGLLGLISQSPELAPFLANATLSQAEQSRAVQALFAGRISPLLKRTIDFLISRRRLAILSDLGEAYEELYRESRQILSAQVTSAFDLRKDQLDAIRRKLETKYQKTIELAAQTDPSLVGGFVLRVRDTVHDFSVRGRLHALYSTLAHA